MQQTPPSKESTEARRREEVYRAWEYSDWSVWCWVLVCFGFFFFFIVLVSPSRYHGAYRGGVARTPYPYGQGHGHGSSHSHSHGHHHRRSDSDSDSESSSSRSSRDDDDDNHQGHSHHYADIQDLPAPPVGYGYYPLYSYEHVDGAVMPQESTVNRVRFAASSALPVIDSDVVAEWRGKNLGYEGCTTDEERTQLDEASLTPSAHVLLNEHTGEIEFVVQAPYIADDGAFVASFEPMPRNFDSNWKRRTDLLHAPGSCQSSGAFGGDDVWMHTPNALYAEAFNKSVLYRGAGDNWQFYPLSCSRFSMHWSTTAEKLAMCRNSNAHSAPIVFSATPTAVTVSGTLWLHYIQPDPSDSDSIVYKSWPFSFALYIDQYESKALLTDVPPTAITKTKALVSPQNSDGTAVQRLVNMHAESSLTWITHTSLMRSWFTPEEDGENVVDTELHKERALRLQLVSTSVASFKLLREATQQLNVDDKALIDVAQSKVPHYSVSSVETFFKDAKEDTFGRFRVTEADFVPQVENSAPATCIVLEDNEIISCAKNWTVVLVSLSSPELYEGAFEVKLLDKKGGDELAHSVRFDVAITDPSSDLVDVEQMQTEITSHLNSAATRQIHEDAFVGGDRVCMQTYAMGPPQLMQSIDVRTIAAWLCVDDGREAVKDPENHAREPHNPTRVHTRTKKLKKDTASKKIESALKKAKRKSASTNIVINEEEVKRLSQRSRYLTTQASENSGCLERRHYIQLFGKGSPDSTLNEREIRKARNITTSTYQPTLHEPGAYGSWSSALCFNITTLFVDHKGNSVHRQRYYFQSEVVVLPTEKRRHYSSENRRGTLHRTFSSFERVALGTAESTKVDAETERLARYVRTPPTDLTSPQLGELLGKLDASKRLDRFHTTTFDVQLGKTRRENHLYNVGQATSISVFFFVIIFSLCLVAATYACLLAYWSKKDDKKPANAASSLNKQLRS